MPGPGSHQQDGGAFEDGLQVDQDGSDTHQLLQEAHEQGDEDGSVHVGAPGLGPRHVGALETGGCQWAGGTGPAPPAGTTLPSAGWETPSSLSPGKTLCPEAVQATHRLGDPRPNPRLLDEWLGKGRLARAQASAARSTGSGSGATVSPLPPVLGGGLLLALFPGKKQPRPTLPHLSADIVLDLLELPADVRVGPAEPGQRPQRLRVPAP